MASFNKVILLGNLTRDPQLSYTPSQTAVVEIGLAVNRKFKKQDGSQSEEVCFVDCQMYGKRAEVINKYCKKGNPLMIEGRLKFDSWQGQDGSKRSKLRVMIESFEFISSGGGGGGNRSQGGGGDYNGGGQQGGGYNSNQGGGQGGGGYNAGGQAPPVADDDIPF
jgi:single-strand DNA-binding protein